MIRNFPIPNTKEDIIEFMILASSNILGEDERDIYEAWLAKFEQAYQKALILFAGDPDIVRIQQIYSNCQINIDTEKSEKNRKIYYRYHNPKYCRLCRCNFNDCFGIYRSYRWRFIFSGTYIVYRPYCVCRKPFQARCIRHRLCSWGSRGLLMILLSFLLFNGSMGQLCGGIVLIIVAVNYFKSLNHSKK